jgi:hypothetical protein
LWLSRQLWLRQWMEQSPAGGRLQRRFVAGVSLADAIDAGRRLQHEGKYSTLEHLGEKVFRPPSR